MITILVVILLLMALGAFPTWPYRDSSFSSWLFFCCSGAYKSAASFKTQQLMSRSVAIGSVARFQSPSQGAAISLARNLTPTRLRHVDA